MDCFYKYELRTTGHGLSPTMTEVQKASSGISMTVRSTASMMRRWAASSGSMFFAKNVAVATFPL